MKITKNKLGKQGDVDESGIGESSDVGLLWKEVGKLQQQLDNENKGLLGWVRKWGVLVAFVLSIFSLTGSLIDLPKRIREAFPKKVHITKPNAMFTVRNLPAGHALEYEFTITVATKELRIIKWR